MLKRIVFDTAKGLEIHWPNPKGRLEGESDDRFIARVRARIVQAAGGAMLVRAAR